jgi:glutaminyl-tRNA synthetase
LFTDPEPANHDDIDFLELFNHNSLKVIKNAMLEPSIAKVQTGQIFQFLRLGYFVADTDSQEGALVFNRIVPLRDTWAKMQKNRVG